MQTDTTNSANHATETTAKTVADFMSNYKARIDAKEREQDEQMRARVEENIRDLRESLQGFLSPDLFAALDFYFSRSVRYPRSAMAEAYFTVDGVAWSIYLDEEWTIHGEQGYSRCPWPINDDAVLSAIAEYPQWLDQQREREREKSEPRTFHEITSAIPGQGFLQTAMRVQVNYARYYGEDGAGVWGRIADWNKQFLLLTLASGRQMLINWQHIESIEPRYPEPQQPQKQRTLPGDFDSDQVPF